MGLEHFILHLLKTQRGRIVVSALGIAVFGFMGAFAWPNVADARRLQRRHQLCMATSSSDPSINLLEFQVDSNYRTLFGFSIVTATGMAASLLWLLYLVTKPNWSAFDRDRRA